MKKWLHSGKAVVISLQVVVLMVQGQDEGWRPGWEKFNAAHDFQQTRQHVHTVPLE